MVKRNTSSAEAGQKRLGHSLTTATRNVMTPRMEWKRKSDAEDRVSGQDSRIRLKKT